MKESLEKKVAKNPIRTSTSGRRVVIFSTQEKARNCGYYLGKTYKCERKIGAKKRAKNEPGAGRWASLKAAPGDRSRSTIQQDPAGRCMHEARKKKKHKKKNKADNTERAARRRRTPHAKYEQARSGSKLPAASVRSGPAAGVNANDV